MAFLAPKQAISNKEPKVTAIQVQTSAYGVAVPIAWGTVRLNGNLMRYGDFQVLEHSHSSGGKGGGAPGQSTYTYICSLQLGLLEGPTTAILKKYNTTTGQQVYMDWFYGADPQSPWAHYGDGMTYPGMTYMATSLMSLGPSGALPNFSFEVQTTTAGAAGTPDAAPDVIVTDLVTSATRGAGIDASRLALGTYQDYVYVAGLFLSPALTEQRRAADWLIEILEATNTAAFWSEGKLKLVPYGDTYSIGNGHTYTPNVTPVYSLSDDDFLAEAGDTPIKIIRKAQADLKNQYRIEYQNRANDYAPDSVTVQDESNVAQFGKRPAEGKRFDCIKSSWVAFQVASLKLQRQLYKPNTYEFRLAVRYCLLEPMDVLLLSHSALGMSSVPVRITKISEGDEGDITVTAEDFPSGAGIAPLITPPSPSGYAKDLNASPGSVSTPLFIEPPMELTASGLEVWCAVSGASSMWGGADVYVSFDGSTYTKTGTVSRGVRYGTLNAAMTSGSSSLTANLIGSGGEFSSVTAAEANTARSLCFVDGEFLSYQGASLVGANQYTLSGLVRGQYRTTVAAHASGAAFARVDDQLGKSGPLDDSMIGKTIYFKFVSFNLYGGGYEDIASVTAHSYTVTGAMIKIPPPDVAGLAVTTAVDGTRVWTWTTAGLPSDLQSLEVRYGAVGSAWASMTKLFAALPASGFFETATPPQGTYRFEARYVDTLGNYSTNSAVIASAAMSATRPNQSDVLNSLVGASSNLLYNASFLAGTDGYLCSTNSPSGLSDPNLSYGRNLSTSWTLSNEGTLWFRQNGTANILCNWYSGAQMSPCMAGDIFEIQSYVGAHRCDVQLRIGFLDSSGASIGDALVDSTLVRGRSSGGQILSGYSWLRGFYTAPAGACFAYMSCRKLATDAGQADSYMFISRMYLGYARAGQTAFSPWSDGAKYGDSTTIRAANPISTGNVTTYVGAGAFGTTQLAASAATEVVSATGSGITITGGTGIPYGTITTIAQITYVAPVTGELLVTAFGTHVYTTGQAYRLFRTQVVRTGLSRLVSTWEDASPGSGVTKYGSWSHSFRMSVVAGNSYTIQVGGQKYDNSDTVTADGELRLEMIKR